MASFAFTVCWRASHHFSYKMSYMFRMVRRHLSEKWFQQFVFENFFIKHPCQIFESVFATSPFIQAWDILIILSHKIIPLINSIPKLVRYYQAILLLM